MTSENSPRRTNGPTYDPSDLGGEEIVHDRTLRPK
ncbi:hypothetical protein J2S16_003124 [Cytobacillus kochii]|nr:hypothetical protein [Cytobacillus kochii]